MATISRTQPLTLHWLVVTHPDGARPTLIGRWGPEPAASHLSAVDDVPVDPTTAVDDAA